MPSHDNSLALGEVDDNMLNKCENCRSLDNNSEQNSKTEIPIIRLCYPPESNSYFDGVDSDQFLPMSRMATI
jgi:hypothetical protein